MKSPIEEYFHNKSSFIHLNQLPGENRALPQNPPRHSAYSEYFPGRGRRAEATPTSSLEVTSRYRRKPSDGENLWAVTGLSEPQNIKETLRNPYRIQTDVIKRISKSCGLGRRNRNRGSKLRNYDKAVNRDRIQSSCKNSLAQWKGNEDVSEKRESILSNQRTLGYKTTLWGTTILKGSKCSAHQG